MTSRQRIIDYLRVNPGSTVSEIARAFRKTSSNIRHHLASLERDKLVLTTRLSDGNRGRPGKAYRLTQIGENDTIAMLAEILLEKHLAGSDAQDRNSKISDLSAHLWAGRGSDQDSLLRQLEKLVDRLTELNYWPRWEARSTGPHVILGFCPYRKIIRRHPELCSMDAEMLRIGLGRNVEQIAKLETNQRGIPVCIFAVH